MKQKKILHYAHALGDLLDTCSIRPNSTQAFYCGNILRYYCTNNASRKKETSAYPYAFILSYSKHIALPSNKFYSIIDWLTNDCIWSVD